MAAVLHSEAARKMMRKICAEFEVDPAEVEHIEVQNDQVYFYRVPLVYDLPADWSVSVHVETDSDWRPID